MDIHPPPEEIIAELNGYPKIKFQVMEYWGSLKLDIVLNRLVTDTKDHTRQGFPQSVFLALLKLQLINRQYLDDSVDEDFPESKFGFDTGFWEIPKNF